MGIFDRFKKKPESDSSSVDAASSTDSDANESVSTPEPQSDAKPEKQGLFSRFRQGLQKTTQLLNTDIRDLFKQEGQLVDDKGNVVGEIDLEDNNSYQKIMVHNKEVAHMNIHNGNSNNESNRLFSLFHDYNSEDEEEMIILSLYNLLVRPRLVK